MSDPPTIDDDDHDDTKNNLTKEDADKENPPIVPKKHQTAQRGRPFSRSIGRGGIRKIQVTDCSINFDKNCVAKSTSANEKKTEMKANKNRVTEEKAKEKSKKEKKEEAKAEHKDTDSNEQKEKKLEKSDETKVETEAVEERKQDNVVNDIVKMTEEENKIENNSVCKEGSFEVSTMIGYVNNSEMADGAGKDDVEVKNVMEDTEIDNNDTHMMLESEEDKEHRIAVIGQSLTISKLEDELAKELEVTFNVQNTEERIRRLKMVLDLLQKSDFTKKDTDIETDKLESAKSEKTETFVEKKEKRICKIK